MKTRNQFWLAVVGLAVLVAIGLALGAREGRSRPVLTLPGGGAVEVRAITYGTNHVVGSLLGRVIARLPAPLDRLLRDGVGARAQVQTVLTPTPSLVVWVGRTGPVVTPSGAGRELQVALCDERGFVSGDPVWWGDYSDNALKFASFPRRGQSFDLCFFRQDTKGQWQRVGRLPLANPFHRGYPQWQPGTLPAVQRAGDLEVTLLRFRTGHNNNTVQRSGPDGRVVVEYGAPPQDGRNYSVGAVEFRPLRDTNESWSVAGVEVADATGNRARQTSLSQDGGGRSFAFTPSLWPDEAAWRLRLELKKKGGFAPAEILVVKGVPLGEPQATNRLALSTNFGPVRLTLEHFFRLPPKTNNSWSSSESSHLRLTHAGLPAGLHLDLISATAEAGVDLPTGSWSSSSSSSSPGLVERAYFFRTVPATARTADFTFVLHASRSVEFLVKPEAAPPEHGK